MSIERIKEEAAKADQMIRDLAQGDQAVAEAEEPVDQEAAQPEVDEQHDQGVVADAATEDQNEASVLDQIREESAKWEQRYRSLDGMIQARDRQIEQLHQLLAGMQQAQPKQETEPKAKKRLVQKEDEDAFGADLVDLNRRVAREELEEVTSQLMDRIAQLEQQLTGVAQTTAITIQDRFTNSLDKAAPQWRTLDSDATFIAWLKENSTRMRVFSEAAQSQDVDGVAYFYNEYAKANTPTDKPTVDPRLEKQLAPGKAKSVAPQSKSQQDKKQWTRSEIAQFYSDGKKRYSSDEYARLERDLFSAQKEGRVDFSR